MPSQTRLQFIDLLRGIAVIVMVEVHVFNAFLQPPYRLTEWFGVLNYINGLVAPSFVFMAGFVFMISSQRKVAEFRTYGKAFWRQMWRILLILLIGYYLHLPYFSFHRMMTETTEAGWLKFYQADVLHCIAMGLFLLFLLRLRIVSKRMYEIVLFSMGMLIVAFTPFVWKFDFLTVFPAPIAAYWNGLHYSQFPFFPWAGFMFFAGFAASRYLGAREQGNESRFLYRFVSFGLVLFVVGGVLRISKVGTGWVGTDVRANPFFFVERLGLVLVLLFICWLITQKVIPPQFVLATGRQSLYAYASHLVVIYGQYINGYSAAYLFKRSWTPFECAVATLGLITAVVMTSISWDWLKREHLPLAQMFFGVFVLASLAVFFVT